MALHQLVQNHLDKVVGSSGYTVSGATATLTATLDHRQMQELINVAQLEKHDVIAASGTVKVQPR